MKLLPLVIFLGLFAAHSCQEKLKVTLLYESLCPDSIKFIGQELAPYYYHLRDYVDLEFVPFGKSSFDGTSFQCQHGPNECAGNRVQSCALNSIWNNDLKMAFVACYMSVHDISGYYCSGKYGIDFSEILHCSTTDLGTQLQLKAEKRTQEFQPTFVPTIVFNGRFDQNIQNKAYRNFLGTVCEFLQYTAPVCSGVH